MEDYNVGSEGHHDSPRRQSTERARRNPLNGQLTMSRERQTQEMSQQNDYFAPLQSRFRRNERPSFSASRSVSLPQRLASIVFNESSDPKKGGAEHTQQAQASRLTNVSSFSPFSASSEISAFHPFKKHRVISESDAKPFGRSKTEPSIAEILLDEDTSDLAINRSDSSLNRNHDSIFRSLGESCFEAEPFASQLVGLHIPSDSYTQESATQRALNTPDILLRIFEELDAQTVIPHEVTQQRRKPISLHHAQLIFGKNQQAEEAWQGNTPAVVEYTGAGAFNCLLVNKLWHELCLRVLEARIHFHSNENWTHFARRGAANLRRKPKALLLHKLDRATQVELELFEQVNLGEQLEWLEFYTCPMISPTKGLLGPKLTKIVLPGCTRVSDRCLFDIAERCPQLQHLDLRACDQVSDMGVKVIARYCPQLETINVGRNFSGHRITYKSVKHLARLTQIKTLGLAGCDIDDRAVWELALYRSGRVERLSLNNCRLLTNDGLPRALGYLPNLKVLEIRGCPQITNMRPIGLLKLYNERNGKYILIEGCEVTEYHIQLEIGRLRKEAHNKLCQNLTEWANRPCDSDALVSI